jgi:hypothetical protein
VNITPLYNPEGADRPSPADSPPRLSVPADPLATANAARSTCEARVRRVVTLYVPDEVVVNAITSAVLSYAQQYAHAIARIYVDAQKATRAGVPCIETRSEQP